jgi:hypothetical protein
MESVLYKLELVKIVSFLFKKLLLFSIVIEFKLSKKGSISFRKKAMGKFGLMNFILLVGSGLAEVKTSKI